MSQAAPSRLTAPGGDGVAIVTRTKNRPLLLRRAIESVLCQSHPNWVQVIVNDGGEPAAVEALVAEYLPRYGERLLVIHNGASVGMEAASNIGLRATDSRFCVIHDDDDAWHPEFLARTVAALMAPTSPTYRGVIAWSEMVREAIEGTTVTEVERSSFNSWARDVSFWRMLHLNSFPPISFLYERSALEEIGYYNEAMPVLGDWEFNLRFLERYDIAVVPEHLAHYHIRTEGAPREFGNSITAGFDRHMTQHTLLVNALLRDDLEKGTVGLGVLANLARDLQIMKDQTAEVGQRMDKAAADAAARRRRRLSNRIRRFFGMR